MTTAEASAKCRLCGRLKGEHEDEGDGLYSCPDAARGFVTADQFEPVPEPRLPEWGEPYPGNPAAESRQRKDTPLYSGCLAYFPDALAAVARLSRLGNDKHNPGEPLHWSKGKSADHADALARHLVAAGKPDPETGLSHTVAVAWRALALLQTEIENGGAS
jgi:hypothetical protein